MNEPHSEPAPNADWITIPAGVFDGDQPRIGETGPEMVFAFVHPTQVEIIDTWYVTGLRASGTQELYIDDVFVPDDMAGLAFMGPAGPGLRLRRQTALGGIPFMSLAGLAQVPPVSLGIARRALEQFRQLALTRQSAFGGRVWRSRCRLRRGWPRQKGCFVQPARTGITRLRCCGTWP